MPRTKKDVKAKDPAEASTEKSKGVEKHGFKKRITKSRRAGLLLPVSRFQKRLKKGNYAPRVGRGAGIYMAATIEYLCFELLDLAANAAKDNNRKRITPRHIMMAIKNDDELNTLLRDVHVARAGVLPSIPQILLYTVKERIKAREQNELPAPEQWTRAFTADFSRSQQSQDKKQPAKKKKRTSRPEEVVAASQQL